jgi:hypothetical protein
MMWQTVSAAAMTINTVTRGDVAVLMFSALVTEAGLHVLMPFSDSLPFDVVVYDYKRFYRVQVKRAFKARDGRHQISLRRVWPRSTGHIHKRYTSDDLDFVAGVVVDTGDVYVLPVSEVIKMRDAVQLGHGTGKRRASNRKFDPDEYLNHITLEGHRIPLR